MFEYLLHSSLCALTIIFSDDIDSHPDFTIGCQFEYTRIKAHDRIDIALGYICSDQRDQIGAQLGDVYLTDIELLFSFHWLGNPDEAGSIASRLRAYFGQDLRRDSGYEKRFWERIQPNLDSFWFDVVKELFKSAVLIFTTFLLIKFGLKSLSVD